MISVSVVVPVRNAMRYLRRTVPSVLDAARARGAVEVIYVDNGSTDGSYEFLAGLDGCSVARVETASVAALRNHGAREARGEYLSFLDADCAISADYFDQALSALRSSGAVATGYEVQLPSDVHWIPAVWKSMHEVGADRDVHWINSANFFISRAVFKSIGGFREDLRTGEDTEIGQRLNRAGHRLRADHRVSVIHYGNPESVRDFYRRSVWHALGMFGTVTRHGIDKPTAMMFLHLFATVAGIAVLTSAPVGWLWRVVIALILQLVAPGLTVGYRVLRRRRALDFFRGAFLYWLYYWARVEALAILILGKGDTYRK